MRDARSAGGECDRARGSCPARPLLPRPQAVPRASWCGAIADEAEPTDDRSVVQDALVKRASDDSWTVVSWQLSQYSGRWLTDALTITG